MCGKGEVAVKQEREGGKGEGVVKGRWLSRWKGQEREGGKGEGVVKGRWDALLRGGGKRGREGRGKGEVGCC